MTRLCLSLMLLLVLTGTPADAQTLRESHEHWKVFTHQEGKATLCYMASTPMDKKGNYSRRDEPFVLVTHRGAGVDEISVSSGFPYQKDSEVTLNIDGKKFALFTQNERAWAYDEKEDAAIVGRAARGAKMTARGTSQKGTFAEDSYSLSGFTKAYRAMKGLCK